MDGVLLHDDADAGQLRPGRMVRDQGKAWLRPDW